LKATIYIENQHALGDPITLSFDGGVESPKRKVLRFHETISQKVSQDPFR